MTVMSLEVGLPSANARWVVVGFGVNQMMGRLPGLLRRLGPHSIGFPETTAVSLGVLRETAAATSAYIVVVDLEGGEASANADQFLHSLTGGEHLEVLITIGAPLAPILAPNGALQLVLTQPAGSELAIASLLMAVTGNGLVGVDLGDIRGCLHAKGPARIWLWQGRGDQPAASAARDLLRSATQARIPPAGIAGATVMAVVPPVWTLHDIVELTGSLPLPEEVDRALAAFTDDGPDAAPVAVVFTYSALPGG